jgi:protein deglycase
MMTAVILYSMFSEYELSVVLSILSQGGKAISIIGLSKTPIQSEAGLACVVDETFDTADVMQLDSLLLPGMMQPLGEVEEAACVAFLKRLQPDIVIGSISASPYLLSKADLLKDHKYTAGLYEEDMDELGMDKTRFTREGITQDGLMLTAKGSCFIEFGVSFGKMLKLTFDEHWYMK